MKSWSFKSSKRVYNVYNFQIHLPFIIRINYRFFLEWAFNLSFKSGQSWGKADTAILPKSSTDDHLKLLPRGSNQTGSIRFWS